MAEHENTSDGTPEMINRREAVLRVTALVSGVALVGGCALLTGCRQENAAAPSTGAENTETPFTAEDVAFLDEVAETILPETNTPGAKAAKTGAFMALMVTDSFSPSDRKVFRDGMRKLDDAARNAHGVSFMAATPQQRLAVLEVIDRLCARPSNLFSLETIRTAEALLAGQCNEPHYFLMIKELALLGYFTSEIGCKQAQRYVEVPGRFDPCVPYHHGEKAWASHA
jgi:hypothetical protein